MSPYLAPGATQDEAESYGSTDERRVCTFCDQPREDFRRVLFPNLGKPVWEEVCTRCAVAVEAGILRAAQNRVDAQALEAVCGQ